MVLAYLPAKLLRHLQFILGSRRAPLIAATWSEIGTILLTKPVSVAVIDPTADHESKAFELERLMIAFPSLPVIAYVPLTPTAFGAVAQLAEKGLRRVVLYTYDDDSVRFLSLLNQMQTSPLTTRFIAALGPKLVVLPLRLAKAIETLFAEPHLFSNAQNIARISTIPLVRVHRALQEAELATPKKVFIAAKLLKAYSYLGDPAHSVHVVARKLGYRHTRILSDHSHELFGLNPSRLHSYLTEDDVLERTLKFVGRHTESRTVESVSHSRPKREI